MLKGAPSLPMPVEISDARSLTPFFNHLKHDGSYETASDATGQSQTAAEPYYNVPTLEFDKGVLYEDGRMDLCKMALGPPNISTLMHSLRSNTFVRHFLLGNNIIGPAGAQAIADFVQESPDRIDTWYLAGNCIDGASFALLTDALVKSPAVTNIWLKRNPLGPESVDSLFRLITQTPNLRTLDLDQTELGDAGVAALFSRLAEYIPPTPLSMRILYLSATGISTAACEAISMYLASPHCPITSLYMSSNPIGDAGAKALAKGLQNNKALQRLSLQSVGLTDEGATALISPLQDHPTLETLDISQSYSTQDLNARYVFDQLIEESN
jgi:Ran GTPase-activating protein (RanGAP) involved in mRNA processing and transport